MITINRPPIVSRPALANTTRELTASGSIIGWWQFLADAVSGDFMQPRHGGHRTALTALEPVDIPFEFTPFNGRMLWELRASETNRKPYMQSAGIAVDYTQPVSLVSISRITNTAGDDWSLCVGDSYDPGRVLYHSPHGPGGPGNPATQAIRVAHPSGARSLDIGPVNPLGSVALTAVSLNFQTGAYNVSAGPDLSTVATASDPIIATLLSDVSGAQSISLRFGQAWGAQTANGHLFDVLLIEGDIFALPPLRDAIVEYYRDNWMGVLS